jgi:hypothetical protein
MSTPPKTTAQRSFEVRGVALDVVGHLVGELAGRRDHQGAHRVASRRHAGVRVRQHLVQQRQREGGGLAVPVWAAPMMSRPARTSGIAFAWIGVIVV